MGVDNTSPSGVTNISGTVAVYFDRSKPIVLSDTGATSSIFSTSGSVSGVSVSGNTILSPSASYNFKIFAFNIFTTGVTSILATWVNGSGAGQTEFYRGLATPLGTPSAIDMEISPPGYLFSTGVNTTLALLLDAGSLVHYSVSYIKESA